MSRRARRGRHRPGSAPSPVDSRPVVVLRVAPAHVPRHRWPGVVRVTVGTLTIAGAFVLVVLVGTWTGLSLVGAPGTRTPAFIQRYWSRSVTSAPAPTRPPMRRRSRERGS